VIPHKPRPPVELSRRHVRIVRPARDRSATVVVAIASRRPPGPDLDRCLASVAYQTVSEVSVVLLLDCVDGTGHAESLRLPATLAEGTWVLTANCGTASRARNAILEFIDEQLLGVRWVARLDADDCFADPQSLQAAVELGERLGTVAVLGGNRVLSRSGDHLRDNPASSALRHRDTLLTLLQEMAEGTARNELPSCNLLTRTLSGIRYPDIQSAEDHWLVADLLFNRPNEVAILESPLFAEYRLDGAATRHARRSECHRRARRALQPAAETWARVSELPGEVLGLGQEGIVRLHQGMVYKHFYPDILTAEKVAWLSQTLSAGKATPAPTFEPDSHGKSWVARYPYEQTTPFTLPDPDAVRDFLRSCLDRELVCANIKRSNFRVREDGSLLFVDVGNWVIPMDVSYFRDSAARLYSIGIRGAADEELLRRPTDPSRPEVWTALPGFAEFYGDVVSGWIGQHWDRAPSPGAGPQVRQPDVTLLIKACAMDAQALRAQVIHIVDQLTQPRDFAERVLLIDPYTGPFLRQHVPGDLEAVYREARELANQGTVNRVIVGPVSPGEVLEVNRRWFGVDATHTHSMDGVPVTPQVWAFDQMNTRYVLQADLDVLIGRRDYYHDFLEEMLEACAPDDVVGVAFNIPQEGSQSPYDAPSGEFKPEVRLGLLDLERIRAMLPLPADISYGRLATTWYRALHTRQRARGLRTLRGGDSATFYIHPPNTRKRDGLDLSRIRDLVAQGFVPSGQFGRWDLETPAAAWAYRKRAERVVVLALGRNTPASKVNRFAAGLAIQEDQSFGVIVVDDASDQGAPSRFSRALAWLGDRLTLIRSPVLRGRVWNNRFAVSGLCSDPETMVLVVDLDDALAHPATIGEVATFGQAGHDVLLAAPFRPDNPTCIYSPSFDRVRQTYGGDVWIHIRAFRKRLFDELPDAMFQLDGQWIENLVDYATMIPIVERAHSPIYLPRYRCWHERTTVLDEAGVLNRDRTIRRLLAKGPDGEDA
jgi:hypothetical protein